MEIYQPEKDSYLLQKQVRKYLKDKNQNLKILDMGSGSGIQAKTCLNLGFENILAADINPDAIKHLKKLGVKSKHTNLFNKTPKQKFDLIIFNPPYLPESKYDKLPDTTGGKQGYETITKFLKQAKAHLNKQGTILLLFSNLTKPNIIKKEIKNLEYKYKKLSEKDVGSKEILYVYELKL